MIKEFVKTRELICNAVDSKMYFDIKESKKEPDSYILRIRYDQTKYTGYSKYANDKDLTLAVQSYFAKQFNIDTTVYYSTLYIKKKDLEFVKSSLSNIS